MIYLYFSSDLFDSENWPAELPAAKKRQQFAENASVTSDETTVGECVPLAPLARLDSLQEMVSITSIS